MIHQYENSTVHLDDCMNIMRGIPDGYYDLAVVDPEYGIGMDNQKVRTKPNRPNTYLRAGELQYADKKWDSKIPDKEYFKQLYRISNNQIVWGANYFSSFIPNGFGWIYWDKQMGENNFSSGEFAFQSFQIKSSSFSFPSMRVKGTRQHPTQKPIALYDWIYTNYLPHGGKVFDSHLGSQSNRISAYKRGNIEFTGCELDSDYFNDGNARFMEFVKKYQPAHIEPTTAQGQNKLF